MKLIIDTNILFSFFWHDSLTRKLIKNSQFELLSPSFALNEISKYKKEIMGRLRIKDKDFSILLKEMKSYVKFIDLKDYNSFLNEACLLSPDKSDADFLALCLKHKCMLWSNDSFLKNQKAVRIISTKDLIYLF